MVLHLLHQRDHDVIVVPQIGMRFCKTLPVIDTCFSPGWGFSIIKFLKSWRRSRTSFKLSQASPRPCSPEYTLVSFSDMATIFHCFLCSSPWHTNQTLSLFSPQYLHAKNAFLFDELILYPKLIICLVRPLELIFYRLDYMFHYFVIICLSSLYVIYFSWLSYILTLNLINTTKKLSTSTLTVKTSSRTLFKWINSQHQSLISISLSHLNPW